jgi:hypothetical protein
MYRRTATAIEARWKIKYSNKYLRAILNRRDGFIGYRIPMGAGISARAAA